MRPPLVMPALSITDAFEMALADADLAGRGTRARRRSGCCCTPATTSGQAHQHEVDALRDRFTGVKVQLLPSGPLSVLAPAAASGDAVNLLQGALAVASPLQHDWRSWRVAAVLAASLLCLHLGARYFELNAAAQERSRARRQHPGSLPRRHARPAERHQRAPARRARLARNRSGGGGGALLPALSAIANARNAAPNAKIEGITFRDGTLDLRIIAPDAASLDAIGQQLRAGELAGGHHGRQRQRRQLSRTAAGPQGGCLMRAWYANLAERERRFVLPRRHRRPWCSLLLAIVLPLNRNIAQARQRVTTKQVDLAFIQNAMPQLAAAGPGVGAAATGESLVVLIDSSRARKWPRQVAVQQPAHRR